MTSTTTAPNDSSSRGFILVIVAIVALGLGLIAFLAAGRDGGSAEEQTAAVEIDGDALTTMPEVPGNITDVSTDPSAGAVAPTITGTDFAGNEITIENDGRPKALYFLAHWCQHCQAEVPVVQELIDDGQVPDGLDLYAISTSVSAERGNFPPEVWLRRESFTPPVIRDDDIGTAFGTFGGTGFPYVVYLDANNQVIARSSGSVPAETIVAIWESAVSAPVG